MKCPNPKKRAYKSKNQALRSAPAFQERSRRMTGFDSEYSAYRCVCGKWHLYTVTRYVEHPKPRKVSQRHA